MASSGARTRRLWAAFLRCKLPVKARMVLATLVYATVTAAVWQHYFNKRLHQMRSMYRAGTNLGQKLWVPPPVYATKHSILLTMAVIPLTMCRKTIGVLSSTPLNRYLPLDSMTEVHRALGVWMIGQTLFAAVAFVVQYGSLCVLFARGWEEVGTAGCGVLRSAPARRPARTPLALLLPLPLQENFCSKFGDEIFVTGAVIPFVCVAMLVTSVPSLRRRLRSCTFEVFWYTHHLFVLLYLLTILHTFDRVASPRAAPPCAACRAPLA
jgi:hypothetical protein